MKQKIYIGVVTLKAKAPKNYRPSTVTVKTGCILKSKSESVLKQVSETETERLKTLLQIPNPDIPIKFTSTIQVIPIDRFTAEYLPDKKEQS